MVVKEKQGPIWSLVGEKVIPPHPQGGYDLISGNANEGLSYKLNGIPHRLDGPAMVWSDGTELWYVEGKLHCDSGAAVRRLNGHLSFYLEGKLQSETGVPPSRLSLLQRIDVGELDVDEEPAVIAAPVLRSTKPQRRKSRSI